MLKDEKQMDCFEAIDDSCIATPPHQKIKASERLKFRASFILNIVLIIAIVVLGTEYSSLQNDFSKASRNLAEVQESYDKSVKARTIMMQQHEEEIEEIIKRLRGDDYYDYQDALDDYHSRQNEVLYTDTAPAGTVWVTPAGEKYHEGWCQYVQGGRSDLTYFKSASEAERHGYEPCIVCH